CALPILPHGLRIADAHDVHEPAGFSGCETDLAVQRAARRAADGDRTRALALLVADRGTFVPISAEERVSIGVEVCDRKRAREEALGFAERPQPDGVVDDV